MPQSGHRHGASGQELSAEYIENSSEEDEGHGSEYDSESRNSEDNCVNLEDSDPEEDQDSDQEEDPEEDPEDGPTATPYEIPEAVRIMLNLQDGNGKPSKKRRSRGSKTRKIDIGSAEQLGRPKSKEPIYRRLGFASWNDNKYHQVRDACILLLAMEPSPFKIDTPWSKVGYSMRKAIISKVMPLFEGQANAADKALSLVLTMNKNQVREDNRGAKGPGGGRGRPLIHGRYSKFNKVTDTGTRFALKTVPYTNVRSGSQAQAVARRAGRAGSGRAGSGRAGRGRAGSGHAETHCR